MGKDAKEILFVITFIKKISEEQADTFWTEFVDDVLEKNSLLWSGGGDNQYLEGGISHKNDNDFDEHQIKNLLLTFVKNNTIIEDIRFIET